MEMTKANAIEFLEEGYEKMIAKKGYGGKGFFTSRSLALEYRALEACIGSVLVFRVGQETEFSYHGRYLVHWA